MKNYIITIMLLCLCFGVTSCDDFLDASPTDKVSEVNYWATENDVNKFLTETYAATFPIVYENSIFFDEPMSDNAYLTWEGWYTNVKLMANGTQDSYGTAPYNIWQKHYECIRKCYQIYENIDKANDLSTEKKEQYLAEARFLEAYNYHRLIIFFNNVPLATKVLSIQESKEITQSERTTVVSHIEKLLEQSANTLINRKMDAGRATWGACKTLLARVYLNENDYQKLLPVTEELMGKYVLHTAGDTPYEDLFSGLAENSDEIIFSIIRTATTGSLKTGHYGNQIFFLKGMSGGDALLASTPSGSLIDSYPMADGRLIKEKGSTYNPSEPYKDRDPRFYQSVIYPSGQIKYLNNGNLESTLYDPENPDMVIDLQKYDAKEPSPTGYMWNKYVDWSLHSMVQITDCTNDMIIMRYADVLLMRAEALTELNGLSAKEQVIDIIDQLRKRCGGGLVQRDNYVTKDDLINLVRNERRIELANEGLRYFDILRWKIAEKTPAVDGVGLKGEFYGAYMRLDGIGKNDRTVMVDGVPRRYVETRYFDPAKHYLQPIPQKEIDLNTNLIQNPNW